MTSGTTEAHVMDSKVEISKRLVFINSASAAVSYLIHFSVLVWLIQHLLWRISPEEYSLYPVLMSVLMFAPLFTMVLTGGVARYVLEAYAKGDDRRVTQIVSTMFPLVAGAGLLMLAGGWLFAWYVDRILTVAPEYLWDARVMMALLVFALAVRLPVAPFSVGLHVRQRFVLLNVIQLVTELLRVGLLFVLLLGVSTRVIWVAVASVSAQLVETTVTLVLSRRLLPALRFRMSEIRWTLARKVTSFGGWSFIAGLADTIRRSADAIILNKLSTALDVTCFQVGATPMQQIQNASYFVRRPLLPPLTAMHVTGARERLRNAYIRGGRYALWLSLLMAVPLIVFRRELITLYIGPEFLRAATVMAMLLLAFPFAYGNILVPELAYATGRMRPWALRSALIQGTNLLLTLCFVGALGMGAVGSSTATLTVSVIGHPLLNWPLGRRLAGVSIQLWLRETIWPGFLPALAGIIIWVGLQVLVRPATWLALGACAASGGVIYVAVLLLFCLRGPDRELLATLVAKAKALVKPTR